MLGRRIDDAIGAKLERLLQNWRRKTLSTTSRAPFSCAMPRLRNIIDFETGIGRRFENKSFVRAASPPAIGQDHCRRRGSRRHQSAAADPRPHRGRRRTWRGPRPHDRGLELCHECGRAAAMPLDVARAASAPSSKAIRCSNMSTVDWNNGNTHSQARRPSFRASAVSMSG